jgi:3-oxoacyl-[acyl-carrier-protein] synthase II
MRGRPVAVTGMGMVTPLGRDLGENLAGVSEGRTGIGILEGSGGWPEHLRYAGRVAELPPLGDIGRKLTSQMKFLNRGSTLGFHSAREALEGSGIDLEGVRPERRALYVASGDFTKIDHAFLYPAIKDATGGKWEDVDQAKLNASTLGKVNPFSPSQITSSASSRPFSASWAPTPRYRAYRPAAQTPWSSPPGPWPRAGPTRPWPWAAEAG